LNSPFVHGDVAFTDKIEHGGESDGSVQVVGEASVEIVCGFGDAFGHGGIVTRRKFSLLETICEGAQAFDRTCGLLQTVEGEIELAAIRNAGKGETNGRRLIAFGEEIADGIEIAERFDIFSPSTRRCSAWSQ